MSKFLLTASALGGAFIAGMLVGGVAVFTTAEGNGVTNGMIAGTESVVRKSEEKKEKTPIGFAG